jgi:hypothetical protein
MYQITTIARRITIVCVAITGLLFFPMAAHSAEVLRSSVTRQGGQYLIHLETVVQAPISKVHFLLKNYKNFTHFNSVFKQVKFLKNLDNGGIRIGVKSEFCILGICQYFNWLQDVQFLSDGDISLTIVPNQGDFQQGNGRWSLSSVDGGTRLLFSLDLTPRYWTPPVLGALLMQQKISDDAFKFSQELEKMAISKDC